MPRCLALLSLPLSLAISVAARQAPAPPSPLHFEVVSIKPMPPNPQFMRWGIIGSDDPPQRGGPAPGTGVNMQVDLLHIIEAAYGLQPYQVGGEPGWVGNPDGFFVIDAKTDPPATHAQLQQMLQNLLADRFKLQVKIETKDMPGYAIELAKGGPKNLTPVQPRMDGRRNPAPSPGSMTVAEFAAYALHPGPDGYSVSARESMPVEDRTGLTDSYNFHTALGDNFLAPTNPPDGYHPAGTMPQTISDYLSDKIGLKLVKTTLPRPYLTILHVEKPTAN